MTIGSDGAPRLLAVLAVGCAIGGIVLAASAMPMLAADSPVATALGDGETSAERDRAIQEAMLEAAAEGDGDLAGRADELGASGADGDGLRTGGSGAGTGAGASGGAGAGALDNQLVQAAALSAMEGQHDLLTNPVVSDALFGLAGIYAAIGGSPGDFAAGAADSDPGAYDDPGDLEPSAYDDPENLEGTAPEDAVGMGDEPTTSGGLLDVPTSANGLEGGYGDLVTDQRAGSISLEGDGAGGETTVTGSNGGLDGESRDGGSLDSESPWGDDQATDGSSTGDEPDSGDGFDANAGDEAWDEGAVPDDGSTDDLDASRGSGESDPETSGGTEDSSASDATGATDASDASDASNDETNGAEDEESDSAKEDTNSVTDSLENSLGPAGERPILTLLAVALAVVVGYVFLRTDDPIATLRALPGRLLALAMGVVVACSRALERAYAALCGLRSIAELPGLLFGAVAGILAEVRTKARSVRASLPLVGDEATGTDAGTATPGDRPTARVRIREAFADVATISTVSRVRVATPTDVAEGAKARGVPVEPVDTITDAFRDVEYGGRDPERRLERTTAARATIRSSLAADDESMDDATSDESADDATNDANGDESENSTGDP
ncbi:hypothetical protein [Natronosalvus halobius]|uniref:hypothetical protein n=1 Tax=Natronosalvus halobius TaxID=2953746 RepID=UPI0020A06AD2|nr:hypothetical protein [Natronosalvus halobius]USZ71283.1 hypothetical protein NGM15_14555 [Natronosalvus halobius]